MQDLADLISGRGEAPSLFDNPKLTPPVQPKSDAPISAKALLPLAKGRSPEELRALRAQEAKRSGALDEGGLSVWGKIREGMSRGQIRGDLNRLIADAADKKDAEALNELVGLQSQYESLWQNNPLEADFFLSDWAIKASESLNGTLRAIAGEVAVSVVTNAAIWAGSAALAGQAGPQVATPEEVVTVPGGAAIGGAVGFFRGVRRVRRGLQEAAAIKSSLKVGTEARALYRSNKAAQLASIAKNLQRSGIANVTKDTLNAASRAGTFSQAMGRLLVTADFAREGQGELVYRLAQEGVDPTEAAAWARSMGWAYGAVESIETFSPTRGMRTSAVAKEKTKDAVVRGVLGSIRRSKAGQFGARYLKSAFSEALVEEPLQEAISLLHEDIIRARQVSDLIAADAEQSVIDELRREHNSVSDYLMESMRAGIQAIGPSLVLGGLGVPGHILGIRAESINAEVVERQRTEINRLLGIRETTSLTERMQGRANRFHQRAANYMRVGNYEKMFENAKRALEIEAKADAITGVSEQKQAAEAKKRSDWVAKEIMPKLPVDKLMHGGINADQKRALAAQINERYQAAFPEDGPLVSASGNKILQDLGMPSEVAESGVLTLEQELSQWEQGRYLLDADERLDELINTLEHDEYVHLHTILVENGVVGRTATSDEKAAGLRQLIEERVAAEEFERNAETPKQRVLKPGDKRWVYDPRSLKPVQVTLHGRDSDRTLGRVWRTTDGELYHSTDMFTSATEAQLQGLRDRREEVMRQIADVEEEGDAVQIGNERVVDPRTLTAQLEEELDLLNREIELAIQGYRIEAPVIETTEGAKSIFGPLDPGSREELILRVELEQRRAKQIADEKKKRRTRAINTLKTKIKKLETIKSVTELTPSELRNMSLYQRALERLSPQESKAEQQRATETLERTVRQTGQSGAAQIGALISERTGNRPQTYHHVRVANVSRGYAPPDLRRMDAAYDKMAKGEKLSVQEYADLGLISEEEAARDDAEKIAERRAEIVKALVVASGLDVTEERVVTKLVAALSSKPTKEEAALLPEGFRGSKLEAEDAAALAPWIYGTIRASGLMPRGVLEIDTSVPFLPTPALKETITDGIARTREKADALGSKLAEFLSGKPDKDSFRSFLRQYVEENFSPLAEVIDPGSAVALLTGEMIEHGNYKIPEGFGVRLVMDEASPVTKVPIWTITDAARKGRKMRKHTFVMLRLSKLKRGEIETKPVTRKLGGRDYLVGAVREATGPLDLDLSDMAFVIRDEQGNFYQATREGDVVTETLDVRKASPEQLKIALRAMQHEVRAMRSWREGANVRVVRDGNKVTVHSPSIDTLNEWTRRHGGRSRLSVNKTSSEELGGARTYAAEMDVSSFARSIGVSEEQAADVLMIEAAQRFAGADVPLVPVRMGININEWVNRPAPFLEQEEPVRVAPNIMPRDVSQYDPERGELLLSVIPLDAKSDDDPDFFRPSGELRDDLGKIRVWVVDAYGRNRRTGSFEVLGEKGMEDRTRRLGEGITMGASTSITIASDKYAPADRAMSFSPNSITQHDITLEPEDIPSAAKTVSDAVTRTVTGEVESLWKDRMLPYLKALQDKGHATRKIAEMLERAKDGDFASIRRAMSYESNLKGKDITKPVPKWLPEDGHSLWKRMNGMFLLWDKANAPSTESSKGGVAQMASETFTEESAGSASKRILGIMSDAWRVVVFPRFMDTTDRNGFEVEHEDGTTSNESVFSFVVKAVERGWLVSRGTKSGMREPILSKEKRKGREANAAGQDMIMQTMFSVFGDALDVMQARRREGINLLDHLEKSLTKGTSQLAFVKRFYQDLYETDNFPFRNGKEAKVWLQNFVLGGMMETPESRRAFAVSIAARVKSALRSTDVVQTGQGATYTDVSTRMSPYAKSLLLEAINDRTSSNGGWIAARSFWDTTIPLRPEERAVVRALFGEDADYWAQRALETMLNRTIPTHGAVDWKKDLGLLTSRWDKERSTQLDGEVLNDVHRRLRSVDLGTAETPAEEAFLNRQRADRNLLLGNKEALSKKIAELNETYSGRTLSQLLDEYLLTNDAATKAYLETRMLVKVSDKLRRELQRNYIRGFFELTNLAKDKFLNISEIDLSADELRQGGTTLAKVDRRLESMQNAELESQLESGAINAAEYNLLESEDEFPELSQTAGLLDEEHRLDIIVGNEMSNAQRAAVETVEGLLASEHVTTGTRRALQTRVDAVLHDTAPVRPEGIRDEEWSRSGDLFTSSLRPVMSDYASALLFREEVAEAITGATPEIRNFKRFALGRVREKLSAIKEEIDALGEEQTKERERLVAAYDSLWKQYAKIRFGDLVLKRSIKLNRKLAALESQLGISTAELDVGQGQVRSAERAERDFIKQKMAEIIGDANRSDSDTVRAVADYLAYALTNKAMPRTLSASERSVIEAEVSDLRRQIAELDRPRTVEEYDEYAPVTTSEMSDKERRAHGRRQVNQLLKAIKKDAYRLRGQIPPIHIEDPEGEIQRIRKVRASLMVEAGAREYKELKGEAKDIYDMLTHNMKVLQGQMRGDADPVGLYAGMLSRDSDADVLVQSLAMEGIVARVVRYNPGGIEAKEGPARTSARIGGQRTSQIGVLKTPQSRRDRFNGADEPYYATPVGRVEVISDKASSLSFEQAAKEGELFTYEFDESVGWTLDAIRSRPSLFSSLFENKPLQQRIAEKLTQRMELDAAYLAARKDPLKKVQVKIRGRNKQLTLPDIREEMDRLDDELFRLQMRQPGNLTGAIEKARQEPIQLAVQAAPSTEDALLEDVRSGGMDQSIAAYRQKMGERYKDEARIKDRLKRLVRKAATEGLGVPSLGEIGAINAKIEDLKAKRERLLKEPDQIVQLRKRQQDILRENSAKSSSALSGKNKIAFLRLAEKIKELKAGMGVDAKKDQVASIDRAIAKLDAKIPHKLSYEERLLELDELLGAFRSGYISTQADAPIRIQVGIRMMVGSSKEAGWYERGKGYVMSGEERIVSLRLLKDAKADPAPSRVDPTYEWSPHNIYQTKTSLPHGYTIPLKVLAVAMRDEFGGTLEQEGEKVFFVKNGQRAEIRVLTESIKSPEGDLVAGQLRLKGMEVVEDGKRVVLNDDVIFLSAVGIGIDTVRHEAVEWTMRRLLDSDQRQELFDEFAPGVTDQSSEEDLRKAIDTIARVIETPGSQFVHDTFGKMQRFFTMLGLVPTSSEVVERLHRNNLLIAGGGIASGIPFISGVQVPPVEELDKMGYNQVANLYRALGGEVNPEWSKGRIIKNILGTHARAGRADVAADLQRIEKAQNFLYHNYDQIGGNIITRGVRAVKDVASRFGGQLLTSFHTKINILVGADQDSEAARISRLMDYGEDEKQRVSVELQKEAERQVEHVQDEVRKLFVRSKERYVTAKAGGEMVEMPLDAAAGIALASQDAMHSDVLAAGKVYIWIRGRLGIPKHVPVSSISKEEQAAILKMVQKDRVGSALMRAYRTVDDMAAAYKEKSVDALIDYLGSIGAEVRIETDEGGKKVRVAELDEEHRKLLDIDLKTIRSFKREKNHFRIQPVSERTSAGQEGFVYQLTQSSGIQRRTGSHDKGHRIDSAVDMLYREIDETAKIHGLMIPVFQMRRYLNNGDLAAAATKKFGSNLMRDLISHLDAVEGVKQKRTEIDNIASWIVSRITISGLAAPFTMVKMAFSFPLAMNVMKHPGLMARAAKGAVKLTAESKRRLEDHWFWQSRYIYGSRADITLSESIMRAHAEHRLSGHQSIGQKSLQFLHKADQRAIRAIWRAAELDVKEDWKGSLDESYWNEVGQRFVQMVKLTQPISDRQHMAQIIAEGQWYKKFLLFYGQRTSMVNQLMMDRLRYINAQGAQKDEAGKRMVLSTVNVLMVNAFLMASIDMLRRGAGDKLRELWVSMFGGEGDDEEPEMNIPLRLAEGLMVNNLQLVPFASEFVELFTSRWRAGQGRLVGPIAKDFSLAAGDLQTVIKDMYRLQTESMTRRERKELEKTIDKKVASIADKSINLGGWAGGIPVRGIRQTFFGYTKIQDLVGE